MKRINAIVAFHVLWVLAPVAGLLIAAQYHEYAVYQMYLSWIFPVSWGICDGCPLTLYEKALRRRFDPEGLYGESFIAHYSEKWLGIKISDWAVNIIMLYIIAFSIVIYNFRP